MPVHLASRSSCSPRPRGLGLLAAALSLAPVAAHAQQSLDPESARLLGQSVAPTTVPLGGPKTAGSPKSPVPIGNLKPSYSVTDVALRGTLGNVLLTRHFSFDRNTWSAGDVRQGYIQSAPFGDPGGAESFVYWWHNFFSYVDLRPQIEHHHDGMTDFVEGRWEVREPGGGALLFDPCPNGLTSPCMAPAKRDPETFDRVTTSDVELRWDGTGFVLYRRGTGRYVFRQAFTENVDSPPTELRHIYFLTEIQDVAGRALATVTYEPGSTRVSEVITPEGSRLRFHYESRPLPSGFSAPVLVWVGIVDTQGSETEAVRYDYVDNKAGLLSARKRPKEGGAGYRDLETYEYGTPAPGQPGTKWKVRAGGSVVEQIMGWNNTAISSDQDGDGTRAISGENLTAGKTCTPGMFAVGSGPSSCDWHQYQRLTRSLASYGATIDVQEEFLVEMLRGRGPTVRRRAERCLGASCGNALERSWAWDWDEAGTLGDLATLWAQGPRGEFTRYAYATSPAGVAEVQSIYAGAVDANGGGALGERHFTYVDGAGGGGYVERLLQSESRPSVLVPGQTTTVWHRYDAQNRLAATFRTGYTRVLQGSTWATVPRTIGTFYFTRQVCSGATAEDPLGRVVEAHGPCEVSGTNAVDCPAGVPVAVTQLDYYPPGTSANRSNRLAAVRTFAEATTGSCPPGPALESTFAAYDARGHLLASTDPNGTRTWFSYDGDRLVTTTRDNDVGGYQSTSYGYDDEAQKQLWVQRPTGEYEVTCYREGTTRATGCVGGTVSDKLQWKALSASPTGASWNEAELYTYQNGRLVRREAVNASGQAQVSIRFDADAFGRQTFEAQGTGGATSAVTQRAFDAGDHLLRLGLPINQAPDFCLVDQAGTYRPCAELAYDRLGRQTELREYADRTTGSASTSCLGYDAHGNVSRWTTGCTASCGACLADPASYPAAIYQHDDFDQPVQVDAPWFRAQRTGDSGTLRMEYDAMGHVVRRQLPTQGEAVHDRYTYDALGRETRAEVIGWGGSTVLHASSYDGLTADPECPSSPNPHRRGRLVSRVDGEGKTCFSYDQDGKVTRADRVLRAADRVNDATRFVGASTAQAYDAAGRLVQQQYPDGRRVYYTYWSGTSRVQAISADLRNAGGSTTVTQLVRNILWAPGGELRSYELVPLEAAAGTPALVVEYLPSDGTAVADTATCAMSRPSGNDGSDQVGGLWVSRGATGAGDVYKARYGWAYGQLQRQAACVLSTSGQLPARITSYLAPGSQPGYDATLQLTNAQEKLPNGTTIARSYSYDRRGNRTAEVNGPLAFAYAYGGGARTSRDWLATRTVVDGGDPDNALWRYYYEADGRLWSWYWDGFQEYWQSYPDFEPERVPGVDIFGDTSPGRTPASVHSTLDTDPGTWQDDYRYVYDASGRRVRKEYDQTNGTADELFWSGTMLLEDRGNAKKAFGPTEARTFPIDQYIWLAGRPVVMIKSEITGGSKDAPSFARRADFQGSCTRNGEASQCGVYFPVNDPLGRPVLMLDAAGKVAGTGEYDPFGQVNREQRQTGTAHPYVVDDDHEEGNLVGALAVDSVPGLQTEVRARLPYVDIDAAGGDRLVVVSNTPYDYLYYGRKTGPVTTGWYPNQLSPTLAVEMWSANDGDEPAWGAALDSVEYRRHELGVTPVWTRLRLPGQYYDPETDLADSWHRAYDPATGRFNGPDPLLHSPKHLAESLAKGRVPRVYAYADNNPIAFTDPTGLASGDDYEAMKRELLAIEGELKVWEENMANELNEILDLRTSGAAKTPVGKMMLEQAESSLAESVGAIKELTARQNELKAKLPAALEARAAKNGIRAVVDGGGQGNGKSIGRLKSVPTLVSAAILVGVLLHATSSEASDKQAASAGNGLKDWNDSVRKAQEENRKNGSGFSAFMLDFAWQNPPWMLDAIDRRGP